MRKPPSRDSNTPAQRLPTAEDVAVMAGVSMMTVSNVVNGRVGRMGEDVHERVVAAIKALNYRPQRSGRSLKFKREFVIGFAMMNPDRRFLDDPFSNQLAAGMSNVLAQLGYGFMFNGVIDAEDLEDKLGRIVHCDALAILAGGPRPMRRKMYEAVARRQQPFVVVQDVAPRNFGEACAVMQDDRDGGFKLTEALLARNAKNILVVVPRWTWPTIERRLVGIMAAAKGKANIVRLECDETNFSECVATIKSYLDTHPQPDAIMGGNDQIGIAALHACGEKSLQVPADLMITGFNAFPFRDFTLPKLTSVTSPAYQIGEEAARALVARVETGVFERPLIKLPVEIADGSTLR
ncbi:LacI family DNA-binding transcriptional regulator [Pseudomonas putida]|uniref:LacI family DNA-binding transcriptional regulator n=1 Tax=Pseudomonas putida TaxID=303 RepID=UPI00300EE059